MFCESEKESWEQYGPPARYSEFRVGESVKYLSGALMTRGPILHISDGQGGQLAIIENPWTGFPDVVPVREILPGRSK